MTPGTALSCETIAAAVPADRKTCARTRTRPFTELTIIAFSLYTTIRLSL
jgi:hypothetical protein